MGGAGHLQNSPLEAAKEELLEEAALVATSWSCVGEIEPMNGLCSERAYIYLARELSSAQAKASEELIAIVKFAPFDEVLAMIRNGQMVDGQSIAAITLTATVLQWI